MLGLRSAAAVKLERTGVLTVMQQRPLLDRVQESLREMQLDDELVDDEMPFAWRGKAAEAAVDAIVMRDASDDDAVEFAMAAFESEAGGEISPEITRERNAIAPMVRRASPVFRRLGRPIARQHRIEVWLDQIEVPVPFRSMFDTCVAKRNNRRINHFRWKDRYGALNAAVKRRGR
jgi:hypothetical protein